MADAFGAQIQQIDRALAALAGSVGASAAELDRTRRLLLEQRERLVAEQARQQPGPIAAPASTPALMVPGSRSAEPDPTALPGTGPLTAALQTALAPALNPPGGGPATAGVPGDESSPLHVVIAGPLPIPVRIEGGLPPGATSMPGAATESVRGTDSLVGPSRGVPAALAGPPASASLAVAFAAQASKSEALATAQARLAGTLAAHAVGGPGPQGVGATAASAVPGVGPGEGANYVRARNLTAPAIPLPSSPAPSPVPPPAPVLASLTAQLQAQQARAATLMASGMPGPGIEPGQRLMALPGLPGAPGGVGGAGLPGQVNRGVHLTAPTQAGPAGPPSGVPGGTPAPGTTSVPGAAATGSMSVAIASSVPLPVRLEAPGGMPVGRGAPLPTAPLSGTGTTPGVAGSPTAGTAPAVMLAGPMPVPVRIEGLTAAAFATSRAGGVGPRDVAGSPGKVGTAESLGNLLALKGPIPVLIVGPLPLPVKLELPTGGGTAGGGSGAGPGAATAAAVAQSRQHVALEKQRLALATSPQGRASLEQQVRLQQELASAQAAASAAGGGGPGGGGMAAGLAAMAPALEKAKVGMANLAAAAQTVWSSGSSAILSLVAAADPFSTWPTFQASVQGLAISVGQVFLPYVDMLSLSIQRATKWFDSLSGEMKAWLGGGVATAVAMAGIAVAIAKVISIGAGLVQMLYTVGNAAIITGVKIYAMLGPIGLAIGAASLALGGLAAAWYMVGSAADSARGSIEGAAEADPGKGPGKEKKSIAGSEVGELPPAIKKQFAEAGANREKQEAVLRRFREEAEASYLLAQREATAYTTSDPGRMEKAREVLTSKREFFQSRQAQITAAYEPQIAGAFGPRRRELQDAMAVEINRLATGITEGALGEIKDFDPDRAARLTAASAREKIGEFLQNTTTNADMLRDLVRPIPVEGTPGLKIPADTTEAMKLLLERRTTRPIEFGEPARPVAGPGAGAGLERVSPTSAPLASQLGVRLEYASAQKKFAEELAQRYSVSMAAPEGSPGGPPGLQRSLKGLAPSAILDNSAYADKLQAAALNADDLDAQNRAKQLQELEKIGELQTQMRDGINELKRILDKPGDFRTRGPR